MSDDIDENYLLNGIKSGFDTLEGKSPDFVAESTNYKSASIANYKLAEAQILKEIVSGNYILVDKKPSVVSSLGPYLRASAQSGSFMTCHVLGGA